MPSIFGVSESTCNMEGRLKNMKRLRKFGNILLNTRYVDICAILILGYYSIIGYPRFMSKYGYGFKDTFESVFTIFFAIWMVYGLFKVFERSMIKGNSLIDSIKYCLKQTGWVFLMVLTLLGYLVNYEFSKQNIWVYLIPIYCIYAIYISKIVIKLYIKRLSTKHKSKY
jgi:hypothetical protein